MRAGARTRIARLVSLAILCAGAACGKGEGPKTASPRDLSCDSREAEWQRAFEKASDAKCADGLEDRAGVLASECPGRWEAPWILGACRMLRDDRKTALASFEDGLARARKISDDVGIMLLANENGRPLLREARFSEAEPLFREAVSLAEKLGRRELEAAAANNLAGVLSKTGRLAEAVRAQQRVVNAYAALHDPRLVRARYNLAILIHPLGNREAARRIYEELLDQAPDAPLRAKIVMRLGMVSAEEGDWERARRLFEEARATDPAPVDLQQGIAELDHGSAERARILLTQAEKEASSKLNAIVARMHLALAELRLGHAAEAEKLVKPTVQESDALQSGDARWRSRHILGKVLLARGDSPGAVAALREAVDVIRRQGAGLSPSDAGLRYLVRRSEPFAELAAVLADRSGDRALPEILDLLDDAHARALQEGLGGDAPPERPGLLELQRRLPAGRVLIGFLLGEERGAAIAIARDAAAVHSVPGLDVLGSSLRAYRATLQGPLKSAYARLNPQADLARGRKAGELLYEDLLAPFERFLDGAQRVDFVLDRELALVPPSSLPIPRTSALHGRGSFLGEVVTTALVPLATAPSEIRAVERPLLLAGDPEPDAGSAFPRLPRARAELDAIEALWRGRPIERLDGSRLRRAQLDAAGLDRFGLLHFATHAIASSRDPSQCAVILSGAERLSLDEILQERLRDSLVVLSACRTGEGEVLPGEGVVGLSWAFLRAGASGVVVSLWSVDDEAASRLMRAFHRHLSGNEEAVAALAAARREVAATSPHPAYWAPFEIVLRP